MNYGCRIGGECGRGSAASAATAAAAVTVAALRVGELARWLPLAPLGPPVLEPDLNARLAELQAQRQLLPGEHVRVGGALEGPF